MFNLSNTSNKRMNGVDIRLIEIANLAIQITAVDFGIPEDGGLRTANRQAFLYATNKSKADGYNDISNHQTGHALDFYAYINGKASWEHEHLAMVAAAFLQAASILGYAVNWGGLWEDHKITNGIPYGWDMAHIELA